MSFPHTVLALLSESPAHGYAVKTRFEDRTAGVWPLNVGQVYSTLRRLERDGLARPLPAAEESRRPWSITPRGRDAVRDWFEEPVRDEPPPRDELAVKVLLASAAESVDVTSVLQTQRRSALQRIQEYTRHLRDADPERELSWVLLLDALILRAEAEVRWLDRCEERLRSVGR